MVAWIRVPTRNTITTCSACWKSKQHKQTGCCNNVMNKLETLLIILSSRRQQKATSTRVIPRAYASRRLLWIGRSWTTRVCRSRTSFKSPAGLIIACTSATSLLRKYCAAWHRKNQLDQGTGPFAIIVRARTRKSYYINWVARRRLYEPVGSIVIPLLELRAWADSRAILVSACCSTTQPRTTCTSSRSTQSVIFSVVSYY